MSLDGLSLEAAAFSLETVRTVGMILATPILFSNAPMRVRGAIALVLSFVAHAGSSPPPVDLGSLERVAMVAPTELLVGVAIGLVVRFTLAAVEIMGEAVSLPMGLGSASLFDPATQTPETEVTRIVRLFAMLLALLLGVHRVLIASLVQSFRAVPVGSIANPALALPEMVLLSSRAISAGVRLALPILAVLLLLQVGLAFLSRAAPALQIFSIGWGITLTAGGFVLFTSLPELARDLERELSLVGGRIETVLTVMSEP